MVTVWDDLEWISSELERLNATDVFSGTGVRVAYRMQLEERASELQADESAR
jgi:hypothetical protein